jgi:hypothetical protein
MKTTIRATVFLVAAAMLCACSGGHMKSVNNPSKLGAPTSGKAKVVFMRPAAAGFMVKAFLYDGDDYIATVMSRQRYEYLAEPGDHFFMVLGESADFMEAHLQPGKTYYALIALRFGVWKARFSLVPHNGQISDQNLQTWLRSCKAIEPTEKGYRWGESNRGKAQNLKNRYMPKWLEKPRKDQAVLKAESGF